MKKLIVIALISLQTSLVTAGEHLEPEDSQFSGLFLPEYFSMVLSALGDAYEIDVRARAIIIPSFQPEYVLGIKDNNGEFSVFHLRPEVSLWGFETLEPMEEDAARTDKERGFIKSEEGAIYIEERIQQLDSALPDDYRGVTILSCELTIASALGTGLIELWNSMLLQTRYPNEGRLGLDGTTYHFSMSGKYQELAGKVWSPPASSKTGKLVGITDSMRQLCLTEDREYEKELEQQVGELLALLRE